MSNCQLDTDEKQALVKLIRAAAGWDASVERALDYVLGVERSDKAQPSGLDAVRRLLDFGVDTGTVIATLLADPGLSTVLDTRQIKEQFGEQVATLTAGVNQLNALAGGRQSRPQSPDQAEKLRRLLMAIISDVRVMLIKLCYRIERLKLLRHTGYDERRQIAQETIDIFAPLANRLGMGLIKWEMEDLAFRALDPQTYKRIALLLEEKRGEREVFIQQFIAQLEAVLMQQEIKAKINGRAKHIVSIWRKMQKKQLEFHQLCDVRAVRVLVDSVTDCYAALGVVHTSWQHIPTEFDDYVANPKENGYQSLHTAVIAQGGQIVEVQIRTREMHQKSEFGVASHWRYKEGITLDQRMEKSISAMREMLEGSAEDASEIVSEISTQPTADRVYVFTPKGQVIEIVKGGTPLDFAYSVHSEVGHRCRGAKVNGRIVTLTTLLQTGDEVEILTTKESRPSRDWMNKNLGFIKSSNIRAKVRNWFGHQDLEQNVMDGKALLERTLTRYLIHHADVKDLAAHFKRKNAEHFFADIGRGIITSTQIIGYLQADTKADDPFKSVKKHESKASSSHEDITVHGVGNLATQFAQCCKPVPGDAIIGFITMGSGIRIHTHNCSNVLALSDEKRQRLIEVEWGQFSRSRYPVGISISAFQRTTLMQDISTILANQKVNLLAIHSTTKRDESIIYMRLTIEIHNTDELVVIIERIDQLRNVLDVQRIA